MATNEEEMDQVERETGRGEGIRRTLTDAVGYIIPLFMSAPGLYAGVMTLPFLGYLMLIFSSQSGISYLFLGGSLLENAVLILSLILLVYSVGFLWRTKSEGLVTEGPYAIIRHPQYLGIILFTSVLTSRSIWVLLNTYGPGYLRPWETLVAWYVMMLAYVGLAMFEERHLNSVYNEEWSGYRGKVGFLLPLLANRRRWLEIVISLVLLAGIMSLHLIANNTFWWFLAVL
jgi:protein-S-isoprenylcysteine O-methyltransferase Ste14